MSLGQETKIKFVNSELSFLKDPFLWTPSSCKKCSSCSEKECSFKQSFDFNPEKFCYVRVRAITADVPNENGDYFPLAELEKSYTTFINRGVFVNHKSERPEDAIGIILDAKLVKSENDNYVELLLKIDRKKAKEICEGIENGIIKFVSMGCLVRECECSLCGNIFRVDEKGSKLCEHMDPSSQFYCKGREVDGKKVYEINRGITFIEVSIVNNPADKTCEIFEVLEKGAKEGGKDGKEGVRKILVKALPGDYPLLPLVFEKLKGILEKKIEKPLSFKIKEGQRIIIGEVKENEIEIKKVLCKEDKVKMVTLELQKGKDLSNSFIIAKEGQREYKISLSSLLPIKVQRALESNDESVRSIEEIFSQYQDYFEKRTLDDFIKYAKRRKKRNKKVLKRLKEEEEKKEKKEAEKKKEKKEEEEEEEKKEAKKKREEEEEEEEEKKEAEKKREEEEEEEEEKKEAKKKKEEEEEEEEEEKREAKKKKKKEEEEEEEEEEKRGGRMGETIKRKAAFENWSLRRDEVLRDKEITPGIKPLERAIRPEETLRDEAEIPYTPKGDAGAKVKDYFARLPDTSVGPATVSLRPMEAFFYKRLKQVKAQLAEERKKWEERIKELSNEYEKKINELREKISQIEKEKTKIEKEKDEIRKIQELQEKENLIYNLLTDWISRKIVTPENEREVIEALKNSSIDEIKNIMTLLKKLNLRSASLDLESKNLPVLQEAYENEMVMEDLEKFLSKNWNKISQGG